MKPLPWLALVAGLFLHGPASAAELVLPQNRGAFYASEPIEFAVAGLKKGESARLTGESLTKGPTPLSFTIKGAGGTVLGILPAGSLAPAEYTVALDGKSAG